MPRYERFRRRQNRNQLASRKPTQSVSLETPPDRPMRRSYLAQCGLLGRDLGSSFRRRVFRTSPPLFARGCHAARAEACWLRQPRSCSLSLAAAATRRPLTPTYPPHPRRPRRPERPGGSIPMLSRLTPAPGIRNRNHLHRDSQHPQTEGFAAPGSPQGHDQLTIRLVGCRTRQLSPGTQPSSALHSCETSDEIEEMPCAI